MLVLSRRVGEAIILAGNIKIQVLGFEYDRVKLGVDAPPDVLVLRSELLDERRQQRRPEPIRPVQPFDSWRDERAHGEPGPGADNHPPRAPRPPRPQRGYPER